MILEGNNLEERTGIIGWLIICKSQNYPIVAKLQDPEHQQEIRCSALYQLPKRGRMNIYAGKADHELADYPFAQEMLPPS